MSQIRLRVSNQKAYVWDVDDIATLRSKYNICGVLTGTLPHIPQQNVFLGVPLVIMPEEVVLLVENKVAVIVDDILAHTHPTPSVLQKYNDERIEAAILQAGIAKGVKQPESAERAMSEEAIRKRKARAQKKAEGPKTEALAVGVSEQLFVPEASITPVEKPTTSTLQYTVNIPTSSSSLPWNSPDTYTYATLAEAQTAGVWNYPSTHHERAKCGVFRSLWEQGYFMGGGIKFGGDYLVYPGDPLRYHSHFVASVLDSPISSLRPMEIVAHGRLGTATKKAHLLCGWDDGKKEVSYFSIEWAGFG